MSFANDGGTMVNKVIRVTCLKGLISREGSSDAEAVEGLAKLSNSAV